MDNQDNKITCPFCGKEVKSRDGFCEHCDALLSAKIKVEDETESNSKKTEPQKVCKFCLKHIPKSSIYCPNCGKNPNIRSTTHYQYSPTNEGSFWLGFLLTFALGFIGLIIALCLNQSETKRGAIRGIIIEIILIVIILLIGGCAICSLLDKADSSYRYYYY